MFIKNTIFTLGLALTVPAFGCASAPETRAEQNDLEQEAHTAAHMFAEADPRLRMRMERSAGYVVFPTVREGAFIAGGAGAVGVAYQNGEPVGMVEMREATFGAQIGGQVFSELVIFESQESFDRLRADSFHVEADASATVGETGVTADAATGRDVEVFAMDERGGMLQAAVGGQRLDFEHGV